MANLQLGIPVSRPLGTHPTAWRATAEGTPRRLEQGWNVSTCDSQAPGAGRSSTTFWHETGRKGESDSYRLWKGHVRPSAGIFGTSGSDQGFARGDAGAAEIARDFLVDVHGMKKRSRAMQECYKRQCHGSMLIWLTAKLIA